MSLGRAAIILCLCASPVLAQSKRGTWEGTAYTGNSSQPVTLSLDSTATGWTGSAGAPETQGGSIPLTGITVKGDTLSFNLNVNGSAIYIGGLVTGNKFSARIWADNNEVGTMELTRKAEGSTAKPLSRTGILFR